MPHPPTHLLCMLKHVSKPLCVFLPQLALGVGGARNWCTLCSCSFEPPKPKTRNFQNCFFSILSPSMSHIRDVSVLFSCVFHLFWPLGAGRMSLPRDRCTTWSFQPQQFKIRSSGTDCFDIVAPQQACSRPSSCGQRFSPLGGLGWGHLCSILNFAFGLCKNILGPYANELSRCGA